MSKKTNGKKWDYRQWTIVTRALCLCGAFLLLGRLLAGYDQLAIPGALLLFPGFVVAAFKLNCPHCGKLIGDLLTRDVEKCPNCNKPLEPITLKKEKKK